MGLGMGILVQHSVGALVQALSPEPGRHTIVLGSGDPSQKRDPILVRGFIPRARARGHARTLRARALYGSPEPRGHVYTPQEASGVARELGPGAPAPRGCIGTPVLSSSRECAHSPRRLS